MRKGTKKPTDTHVRDVSGRYTCSDMDRPCTCGHTLGVHTATGAQCIAGDFDGTIPPCECPGFNPAKKKRKQRPKQS